MDCFHECKTQKNNLLVEKLSDFDFSPPSYLKHLAQKLRQWPEKTCQHSFYREKSGSENGKKCKINIIWLQYYLKGKVYKKEKNHSLDRNFFPLRKILHNFSQIFTPLCCVSGIDIYVLKNSSHALCNIYLPNRKNQIWFEILSLSMY